MKDKLNPSLLDRFMKGDHVIHFSKGYWKGIWSDMGIKSTYIISAARFLQNLKILGRKV